KTGVFSLGAQPLVAHDKAGVLFLDRRWRRATSKRVFGSDTANEPLKAVALTSWKFLRSGAATLFSVKRLGGGARRGGRNPSARWLLPSQLFFSCPPL